MSICSTGVSRDERAGLRPITIAVAETKRLSGLGLTSIWKLIKLRRLKATRVNGRTLVFLHSLEELLAPTEEEC
jgi:hypothetical protein